MDEDEADDAATTLSRLQPGEQFAYEFVLGDGWQHLCTVGPERIDPTEVYGPDPDRWLGVAPIGSREAWEDMREFAGTIEDGELGERLLHAIAGRGAFRAFRLLLDDHPGTRDAWRIFADERRRSRAREWLAAHGYRLARPADS